MARYSRSRAARRIVDPATHPDRAVCLKVAAEFLGYDDRTVKLRIEQGKLPALVDGKVIRIDLAELLAYRERMTLGEAGKKFHVQQQQPQDPQHPHDTSETL